MGTTAHPDHDADPATDHAHDDSRSVPREMPNRGTGRSRAVADAAGAAGHAAPGTHADPVAHDADGHPGTSLHGTPDGRVPGTTGECVERRGRGGHVTRVRVE